MLSAVMHRPVQALGCGPIFIRSRHLDGLAAETADPALAAKLNEILEQQKRDARFRTITFLLGVGGAIFAAVRLGVIAFPVVRERHAAWRATRRPSTASEPAPEPALEPAPAFGRRSRRYRAR